MFGRALVGVLLACICALAWAPGPAAAQDPDSHSASPSQAPCAPSASDCVAGARPPTGPRVLPSTPSRLAEGHSDQSTPILLTLGLIAFGGLVISVLNRLSEDER